MLLDVLVLTPQEILFEGKAKSVILPGESGVFEVQPFHKRIMSRLISGVVFVDSESLSIRRGIAMVENNKVTVIAEGAS